MKEKKMNDLLKIQKLYEIREALEFKKANQELYDLLIYNTVWLLKYCQKNGIKLPNIEQLYVKIKNVRQKVDNIYPANPSDEFLQHKKSDKDFTKPNNSSFNSGLADICDR